MKVTLKELDKSIGNMRFPGPLSKLNLNSLTHSELKYKLGYLVDIIGDHLERAGKQRSRIVDEFARHDSKTGEISVKEGGEVDFENRKKREDCEVEIENLYDTVVDLPMSKFSVDEFRSRTNKEVEKSYNLLDDLNGAELMALRWLVDIPTPSGILENEEKSE